MKISSPAPITGRRRFLFALSASGIIAACSRGSSRAEDMPQGADTPAADQPVPEDWSALTEADWRQRLTEQEFYVLREEGTERAFTSPLNDETREGIFHCAGCDLALFSSETKYKSGTGWPSFWAPLEGALETKPDRKLFMTRTEYHCVRCGGHQGHVFDDGPAPTGQRWCNNGVALAFVPRPS